VIVAVIRVDVVQVSSHEIVDVVAMGNSLVATARAVFVSRFVSPARVT
jgi:hypothetical protein